MPLPLLTPRQATQLHAAAVSQHRSLLTAFAASGPPALRSRLPACIQLLGDDRLLDIVSAAARATQALSADPVVLQGLNPPTVLDELACLLPVHRALAMPGTDVDRGTLLALTSGWLAHGLLTQDWPALCASPSSQLHPSRWSQPIVRVRAPWKRPPGSSLSP